MISPELLAEFEAAKQPYLEGGCCMTAREISMRPWRMVLEINSACNVQCALCFGGNMRGYEYKPGVMKQDLLEKVLDKLKQENPEAIVCCYSNSDPMIHPRLPEAVKAIKDHGFRLELSSNLNRLHPHIDEVVCMNVDLFTVSVSGWTQSIYERAHHGGDIQRVKDNLVKLIALRDFFKPATAWGISYHLYPGWNESEAHYWSEWCSANNFQFLLSWARAINIENMVQSLRGLEQRAGVQLPPLDPPWLPPENPEFTNALDWISFNPIRARETYAQWPVRSVCITADVFAYVRFDGVAGLCPWSDDRRLSIGNYLEMSQDQLREARLNNPLCKECLRYRLNLYTHIVRPGEFNPK